MRKLSFETAYVTPSRTSKLHFRPVTPAALPEIKRLLRCSGSRACDYTIGGIYMWIDYFKYEYCVYHDTLFISGIDEGNMCCRAFAVPVGRLQLSDSVGLLRDYCRRARLPLRFSAVPDDLLTKLLPLGVADVRPLPDWGDYIYDAQALASLSGKKFGKKRNHVNRFMQDNPGYVFEPLTDGNAGEAVAAYRSWELSPDGSATAATERAQTLNVLERYGDYPFEGGVLRNDAGRVVAFTVGELIGDTLHVHIEKMDYSVAGSGETVNKMFASQMLDRHGMKYINREDDSGDEGLRRAKLSYNPVMILQKYDVMMNPVDETSVNCQTS